MIINVGNTDRILRFLLALFLIGLGLFGLDGLQGSIVGVLVALVSLMPFYMAITRSCFAFRWLNIHWLSKAEYQKHGEPYLKNEK